MICRICKRVFYEKRKFLDLFKKEEGYICNMCYKKYPIHLKNEFFRLENHNCLVVSIFDYDYKINYNYFIEEYQKIFERLHNLNGSNVLFFDSLDLSYDLELLNIYANLLDNNIIILTFNLRM